MVIVEKCRKYARVRYVFHSSGSVEILHKSSPSRNTTTAWRMQAHIQDGRPMRSRLVLISSPTFFRTGNRDPLQLQCINTNTQTCIRKLYFKNYPRFWFWVDMLFIGWSLRDKILSNLRADRRRIFSAPDITFVQVYCTGAVFPIKCCRDRSVVVVYYVFLMHVVAYDIALCNRVNGCIKRVFMYILEYYADSGVTSVLALLRYHDVRTI